MKPASPALIALLNSGANNFIFVDCFTFTLQGGATYNYVNAGLPITISGVTYSASSVRVQGVKYSCKRGLTSGDDGQDLTVIATAADLLEGLPFLVAMAFGLLDDARVTCQRAFLPAAWRSGNAPATPVGAIEIFDGWIAGISELGLISGKIKVKAQAERIDRDYPRNLYGAYCQWTLYGYGCGVNPAGYTGTATVAAGSTAAQINLAGASFSNAQPFQYGTIEFTSGALNGVVSTIWSWGNTPLTVGLMEPLGSAPAVGTTCTLTYGCDHTAGAQGCAKFGNLANRRSFEWVPPPGTGL